MDQNKYKKGHLLVWLGFLSAMLFNILNYLGSDQNLLPNLQQFSSLFSILGLIGVGILVYGCILVLKSKNRYWAWIFTLILNVIGIIIIFALKDKTEIVSGNNTNLKNDL